MPGESVFVALQEIPLTTFIKGEMTNSCFSSVTSASAAVKRL